MLYHCNYCNEYFREPYKTSYTESHGERIYQDLCPWCNSDDLTEEDEESEDI